MCARFEVLKRLSPCIKRHLLPQQAGNMPKLQASFASRRSCISPRQAGTGGVLITSRVVRRMPSPTAVHVTQFVSR